MKMHTHTHTEMKHLEDQSLESAVHSGIFINYNRAYYMMAQPPIMFSYLEVRNKTSFLRINGNNKFINYSYISLQQGDENGW